MAGWLPKRAALAHRPWSAPVNTHPSNHYGNHDDHDDDDDYDDHDDYDHDD